MIKGNNRSHMQRLLCSATLQSFMFHLYFLSAFGYSVMYVLKKVNLTVMFQQTKMINPGNITVLIENTNT